MTITAIHLFNTLKRRFLSHNQPITQVDITIFLRQFATLISAGIPVIQCCDILEKSQKKTTMRLLIYSIKREILSGKNLYFSLRNHPQHFDALICQLIQIGEHTGKLDMMLNIIANYYEKSLAFKKRIKQALFYPCIITITALMVTFSMFIFVIPRFAELFQDSHNKLPLLTVWIFYLSTILQQHIGLLLSVIFIFAATILRSKRSAKVKSYLQKIAEKLPFIQQYIHKITLTRFARNLAITFAAGIPITDALKLTANASGNLEFVSAIRELRSKISSGMQLHHAMEMLPYFPVLMIQMVKIGEESGMLEQMLDKIVAFFESDIDQLIGHLSQLFEPLIMMILGVLIGGLIIGMYLPLLNLGRLL